MSRKSKPDQVKRMSLKGWLLGALVVGVLGGAAAYYQSGGTDASELMIPAGVALTSWYDNGTGGRYLLQVAEGRAPAAGEHITGIVRTDTTCTPDAQGLSHCHNAIDLANGTRITVIDNHQMSRHPCLQPGAQINLTGVNASWIVGKV